MFRFSKNFILFHSLNIFTLLRKTTDLNHKCTNKCDCGLALYSFHFRRTRLNHWSAPVWRCSATTFLPASHSPAPFAPFAASVSFPRFRIIRRKTLRLSSAQLQIIPMFKMHEIKHVHNKRWYACERKCCEKYWTNTATYKPAFIVHHFTCC